jgi:hypothetical protein
LPELAVTVGLPDLTWTPYGSGARSRAVALSLWDRVDVALERPRVDRVGLGTTFRLQVPVSTTGTPKNLSFTVTGATVTGTSTGGCSANGAVVTCDKAPPTLGLEVVPTVPRAPAAIQVKVSVPAGQHDTVSGNDDASVTPAASPDVVFASLTREPTVDDRTTRVHAVVSDVPAGTRTVRFTVVGEGVRFSGGDAGVVGAGAACYMGRLQGTWEQTWHEITCDDVSASFSVHMLVQRDDDSLREARIDLVPVNLQEYGQTVNNSRIVTLY